MADNIEVSVVVPLYNEQGVVDELHRRLTEELVKTGRRYEIVFVDDGSKDNTYKLAHQIALKDDKVKLVKLRGNFGQTAGIAAGIDHASGDIIIPMDGDLQHDPSDLPNFLAKIDEGYDIVSGWREKRVDGLILRRIPSLIANRAMRHLSGIQLHDFGTTYKAYRRDVIENVRLYGQFHRFIPVLCKGTMKVNIAEIPIKNIVRPVGQSNYGIWRAFTVFFDLIRLKFLMSFYQRPLQVFGSLGFGLLFAAMLIGAYIVGQRLFFGVTLSTLGSAIFLLATSLGLAGLQLVMVGLLAELFVKLHFEGFKVRCYKVAKTTGSYPNPIYPSLKPDTK